MYVNPPEMSTMGAEEDRVAPVEVVKLALYPVKSCGAFEPAAWPCTATGLAFDRHFMVVDERGRALTQKQHPQLATVLPGLDVERNLLTLTVAGGDTRLVVPLLPLEDPATGDLRSCRVCAEDVLALDCGAEAGVWFTKLLGVPARLVRQSGPQKPCDRPSSRLAASTPEGTSVAFANEAPFLMVSQASMAVLQAAAHEPVSIDAFRANIVVAGPSLAPWAEDTWSNLMLATEKQPTAAALAVMGPCARCRMVSVDQATGVLRAEPLQTLSRLRQRKVGCARFCRARRQSAVIGLMLPAFPRLNAIACARVGSDLLRHTGCTRGRPELHPPRGRSAGASLMG
jgi:uncharacterized protein YcbX